MGRLISIFLILQLCVLIAAQRTEVDSPANLELYSQYRHAVFRSYGARSSQVPTSVNRLRPGDIYVFGSMGDSLSAGYAIFATNGPEIIIENRGVTATSGGQGNWRTYVTLPNILKEFNPKLFGYALRDSFTAHSVSQFDVAETGAMSRDMPFMAQYLVNKIKKDPRIDMKNHWKVVH